MATVCHLMKTTICLLALFEVVGAQEGFTSLECGSDSNYFDPVTRIEWIPDINFTLYKGSDETVARPILNQQSGHVRVFDTESKSCYNLTTVKGHQYLIRGSFQHGDIYWKPVFNVAIDATFILQANMSVSGVWHEAILTATRDYLTYCLIPIRGFGSPYISSLELRPLRKTLYTQNNSSIILKMLRRIDLGNYGSSVVRYPHDALDRIWSNDTFADDSNSFLKNISFNIGDNMIPNQVLQTARAEVNRTRLEFIIEPKNQGPNDYRVFLYFLEIYDNVRAGQRVFDIYANGEKMYTNFDILGNATSKYRKFDFQVHSDGGLNISLVGAAGKFGPICNAYEVYQIISRSAGTVGDDVDALVLLRDAFLESNANLPTLQRWSGDPCLPMSEDGQPNPWEGVKCKSDGGRFIITELDLSSKDLQGPIPSGISKLTNLETLNLSNNNLDGSIPDLSNLPRLVILDIQNNDLKGIIPSSLAQLPNLTYLLVGCNEQLDTTIPPVLHSKQPKLKIDFGMCQKQLNSAGSQGREQRTKLIIGGFVGGSFLLLIAVGIIFRCFYKQHTMVDSIGQSMPKYIAKSIPEAENLALKSFDIETFTLKGLELATNNYENMIGEGGFGTVYRGTLADGQEVAVKVRSATSIQGTREFKTELNLLSEIRHENLVPLLGFCSDKDQQILVYPFMSNGSLQDRLYGEAAKRKPLDWQTRLSIALGAARGLYFLHTGGERCIIHRDVKSSNILLDHSMVAKVADFGFSKYAPQEGDSIVSLEVRGTAGYLDPEYYSSQQLTVKSDIFSFGVVLLEIICGREPLNIHRPRDEWSLVEWAKPFIRESNIDAIVDPVIRTSYTPEAMWRVVEIALTSVEPFSVHRPSMEDIVRELEDALIIENNASQYMRSIESFGSSRFNLVEPKVLPPLSCYQNNPSPVFSETLGSPHPR